MKETSCHNLVCRSYIFEWFLNLLTSVELANPPTIWAHLKPQISTAVLMMVNPDVPLNGERVILLHRLAPSISTDTNPFTIPSPDSGAPYLQPSPPAGDYAHTYVFMLFEQPPGFQIPANFASIDPPATITARFPFNLTGFIEETGLKNPLAANYMHVENTNRTATTSYPLLPSPTLYCHEKLGYW
jgi:phosphatidylethanolamine-binding protein